VTNVLARHGVGDLVAYGAGGERSRVDLLRDAAAIAAALPPAREGSHVLLVIERDRYAVAAAMLGAWAAGHAVAFPPQGRRASVGAVLVRPEISALVHDTAAGGHLKVERFLGGGGDPLPAAPPWPSGAALTFYRMGEGGELVGCARSGAAIEADVAALLERIPELHARRSAATIEPFGPIGVLLGLLVPLCSGGAFARLLGSEEAQHDVVVSLPRGEDSTHSGVRVVASSTGQPCARAAHELLVDRKTRFVATRERGARAWTMLGDFELAAVALAPGVTLGPGPTPGTCLVVPVDARVEVEAWLRTRPGVCDAALAVAPGPTWLAVVAGDDASRTALLGDLQQRLGGPSVDLELRHIVRVPREPEGEVDTAEVFAAFGRDARGRPMEASLRFGEPRLEKEGELQRAELDVEVPSSYQWFLGHFATYPIMAGVVQLHELVLPAVHRVWPSLGDLESLQKLKFLGRIVPGDRVRVHLRLDASAKTCDFTIDKAEKPCAAGRLKFGMPS